MSGIGEILGLEPGADAWWQILLRTTVVYLSALAMVRIGEKRFLGKSTPFDVIVGVMLGSVVSRGITAPDTLVSSTLGGATIVALHWALAWLSFHSERVGTLIKGRSRVLVADGALQKDAMKRTHISREDLLGALRSEGVDGPDDVREARIERSGNISVLKRHAASS